jgi:choline dehydrogenase-like flavoprotein
MKEGEMRIARGIGAAAVVAVAIIVASAAGAGSGGAWAAAALQQDQGLEIVLLSSRPEFVTGGDAVVRVQVPAGVSLTAVSVTLNGADVTGSLRQDAASHNLVGLVTGLGEGANQLKASTKQTNPSLNAQLRVRNQPAYGPTFSGPHQRPWICETVA